MIGYIVLTLLIFLAGVLAGYKLAWMDAYYKGRRDAQPPFDVRAWHRNWLRLIENSKADGSDKRLVSAHVPWPFE